MNKDSTAHSISALQVFMGVLRGMRCSWTRLSLTEEVLNKAFPSSPLPSEILHFYTPDHRSQQWVLHSCPFPHCWQPQCNTKMEWNQGLEKGGKVQERDRNSPQGIWKHQNPFTVWPNTQEHSTESTLLLRVLICLILLRMSREAEGWFGILGCFLGILGGIFEMSSPWCHWCSTD